LSDTTRFVPARRWFEPAAEPFNFTATVHKPSHFPAPIESFDGELLHWPMRLPDSRIVGIQARAGADGTGVDLIAYTRPDATLTATDIAFLSAEIRHRLALDVDLREFHEFAGRDPLRAPAAQAWAGMRPSCLFSLYELLCITTCLQNAQVGRSVTMLGALLAEYGKRVDIDGTQVYAFWTPTDMAQADENALRALKVGYRAKTFIRAGTDFAADDRFEVALRGMTKSQAHKALQRIYGVGPASAWYLLFESLKHLDAFDYVSPWERKILAHLLFDEEDCDPERLLGECLARWGRYRMLAVHYLFENLFWQRKHGTGPHWLDELILL
jgi:3-methyladenine DNA glycosylase/8-oxoguanine DNA glycosylase